MPGRRVEERVKSNEATKRTRGSQQPSKGSAQGRGHGSTRRAQHGTETPERGAPEGKEKSGTAHHDTHGTDTKHAAHTQRAQTARAVGGKSGEGKRLTSDAPHNGRRHPPRERPSATRERATPARNGARLGPPLGLHARTDCTRDTRVAEPRLPAPEDGRLGEGQRLTPGAPHNGGRTTPPGDGPPPPPLHAAPTGHAGQVDSVGPPHPHTRAHSTCVADPNSLPSGRAVRGETAPDLRRPSQWWKAPTPGTPFRHPHSEQGRPARAYAVGPVLGPHARTDRTQRPSQRWQATPPGTPPHHPRGMQPPQGMQAAGTVLGSHTHTPAPTARGWRTPTARPVGEQSGKERRLDSDAPHNGGRHPARGRFSATPTASNAGPQGGTLWGRCWVLTPAPTASGTHWSRNPGRPLQRTGGRGRDSA